MGERAKDVSSEQAMEYVFGATCFNDVTARDLQRADKTFTRGKGFDTFGPCGPWIETEFNLEGSRIETRVNGAVRQSAPISQMIFSMRTLVAYISTIMTLEAGDLVVTGTPEGVGPLSSGDEVEVDITGVGLLRHGVK